MRALAKQPAQRYRSAREMGHDLTRLVGEGAAVGMGDGAAGDVAAARATDLATDLATDVAVDKATDRLSSASPD
jgi:hypothetical protein